MTGKPAAHPVEILRVEQPGAGFATGIETAAASSWGARDSADLVVPDEWLSATSVKLLALAIAANFVGHKAQ